MFLLIFFKVWEIYANFQLLFEKAPLKLNDNLPLMQNIRQEKIWYHLYFCVFSFKKRKRNKQLEYAAKKLSSGKFDQNWDNDTTDITEN